MKQLDISMADRIKIEVFSLQYADAAKLAEVITKLYEKPKDTETAAVQERQQRRRGGGFGDRGQFGTGESPPNEDTLKQGGALQLLGEVKAVADENTNSLIVSASQPNLAVIRNLVSELGTQRYSEPETRVFSLEFGDASEIASELNLAFSSAARDVFTGGGFGGFGGFGGRGRRFFEEQQQARSGQSGEGVLGLPELVAVADARTNSVMVTTTAQQMDAVGNLIEQLDRDIADFAEDTRIFTLEHADAANVSAVPFLVSTQETATGGILTSTDFRDVGVILTVTPRINRSGTVSLDVNQQINSLVEFTLFDAPIISTREASAFVTIKDKQTMVIGGMIRDDKTETVHKIPVLGSIPLLGRLFRRTDMRIEKTELMVFITTHVIHTEADADRVTAAQRVKLNLQGHSREEK